jgi:hypothetical protein
MAAKSGFIAVDAAIRGSVRKRKHHGYVGRIRGFMDGEKKCKLKITNLISLSSSPSSLDSVITTMIHTRRILHAHGSNLPEGKRNQEQSAPCQFRVTFLALRPRKLRENLLRSAIRV